MYAMIFVWQIVWPLATRKPVTCPLRVKMCPDVFFQEKKSFLKNPNTVDTGYFLQLISIVENIILEIIIGELLLYKESKVH